MKKVNKVLTVGATVLLSVVLILSVLLGDVTPAPTSKETPEEFFKGKTGQILVGYGPGGSYDILARLIAPFFGTYTGSTWVVRNMPGGGGMGAANYLYNAAKPDGLTIFHHGPLGLITSQVTGEAGANFDLRKFNYLGIIGAGDQELWLSTRFLIRPLTR